ncbi:integral membrane protein [Candidatus Scalindua japonica]|uniref:Integral membrane protein n=1 Tax=Candidatus Scalindua japonica TaxID=1284222 RepID=A0A286U4D4_9BACT|nr:integral membrane protein [Candidatus Scalindua japonica]
MQNILFATTAAFILGLISFVPGGLGVRDAISAFVLHLSGLEAEMAISITLINRVIGICTVLVILTMINLAKKLIPAKAKHDI